VRFPVAASDRAYYLRVQSTGRPARSDATAPQSAGRGKQQVELRAWALDDLYQQAGSIARDDDRYGTLLTRHPLHLSG
jgi:hypothetical protein